MSNDLRVLRRRIDEADVAEERMRRNGPSTGAPTMFGTVVNGGAMSSTEPNVFLIQRSLLTFQRREGAPVSIVPRSGAPDQLVAVIGPGVPVAGDILIARFAPGGRWISDFGMSRSKSPGGGCGCTCIPKTLVLDSDLSNNEWYQLGGDPLDTYGSYPITFTWQQSAVHALGVLAGDATDPSGNIFGYIKMPPEGWFSKPIPLSTTDVTTGETVTWTQQYWLYGSGCRLWITVFYPRSVTVYPDGIGQQTGYLFNASLQSPVTIDGTIGNGSFSPICGILPANCDNFEINIFAYAAYLGPFTGNSVDTTVASGTSALDLAAPGGSYYGGYYGDCVPLDSTGSAGTGTLSNILDLQSGG